MREILFRGKDKHTGEMIFGTLDNIDEPYQILFRNPNRNNNVETHTVITETVGQYIGLTDKNGVKIFEGDIVKAECDLYHGENKKERVTHIGTVIYDKKFCQFGINVAGFSKCYNLNRWKGDYNEVIGNIHDNPELLKGGDDNA